MTDPSPETSRQDLIYAAAPAVFVMLWSSGFIAAKAGLAHAETLTFLSLRYTVVTILMTGVAFAMRAPWPKSWREIAHIAVAGTMLQAIYFGGVWLAMGKGVGAGVAALIVCLQPVITAVLVGPMLGERVSARQWLGLGLGITGVALVVAHRLALGIGSVEGMVFAFMGLLGITFGTLYQKKYCAQMDPRSGSAVQFLVTALLLTPLSLLFEDGVINWTPAFIASLAYVAVFLSLISMALLTIMIRRGEASRVSSLFFLVPPMAALLAYLVLNEPLGTTVLVGMAVTAIGVALVMMPNRSQP
ncbi:MAG: DMT family transporter [Geminicoccaceae bacterium]